MISRITRIGFTALAFIVIAGISTYTTLTLLIKQENTVIVPDLVGKDVVEVLFVLTDLGLNTKLGGAEYSANMPANHVVFQEPRPGDEIKKDRDVRIILSKGPKNIQVPNLKGVSISQARILLEEDGLCLGAQSTIYSDKVRKDDIVAHSPAGGRTLSRGSCVDILVSSGARPAAYKMPDLNGRPLEETMLLFESIDLKLGTVRPVSYKSRPWNSIVEQEPLPGHRVMEGFRVDLAVNRSEGETDRDAVNGLAGVHLFRYRAADGFLNRRIRVRLNGFGGSIELYDDFLKPGDEIWYVVPDNPGTTLLLYEDGALAPALRDEWESVFSFQQAGFDFEMPDLDAGEG